MNSQRLKPLIFDFVERANKTPMLRYIFTFIILISAYTVSAQTSSNQPSAQVVALTNQMKNTLSLSPAQVQQVQQINHTREVQLQTAMEQNRGNKIEASNALNTVRTNYLNQLQAVLTEQQWQTYLNSQTLGIK